MNDRLILTVAAIAGLTALAWGYRRWTRNTAAWHTHINQALALTQPLTYDDFCAETAAHEARYLNIELWLETGGGA